MSLSRPWPFRVVISGRVISSLGERLKRLKIVIIIASATLSGSCVPCASNLNCLVIKLMSCLQAMLSSSPKVIANQAGYGSKASAIISRRTRWTSPLRNASAGYLMPALASSTRKPRTILLRSTWPTTGLTLLVVDFGLACTGQQASLLLDGTSSAYQSTIPNFHVAIRLLTTVCGSGYLQQTLTQAIGPVIHAPRHHPTSAPRPQAQSPSRIVSTL